MKGFKSFIETLLLRESLSTYFQDNFWFQKSQSWSVKHMDFAHTASPVQCNFIVFSYTQFTHSVHSYKNWLPLQLVRKWKKTRKRRSINTHFHPQQGVYATHMLPPTEELGTASKSNSRGITWDISLYGGFTLLLFIFS